MLPPVLTAVAVVEGKGQRPGLLNHHVESVVPAGDRALDNHRRLCSAYFIRSQRPSQTAMGIRPHSSSSVRNTARANGRWRITTLPATHATSPSRHPCTVPLFRASYRSSGRAIFITCPSNTRRAQEVAARAASVLAVGNSRANWLRRTLDTGPTPAYPVRRLAASLGSVSMVPAGTSF